MALHPGFVPSDRTLAPHYAKTPGRFGSIRATNVTRVLAPMGSSPRSQMDESQNITLLERLESATKPTFEELGHDPELGTITVSAKSRAGDFQCNGAMAAARNARQS